jgi:hypothetical protein
MLESKLAFLLEGLNEQKTTLIGFLTPLMNVKGGECCNIRCPLSHKDLAF